MKSTDKIIRLVTAALMAAMTCVVTILLMFKIPNTSNGYIHPGDAFVLLSGIILGPIYGALAAGIGSLFADLYLAAYLYAPATLVIKALAAFVGASVYRKFRTHSVILAGIFSSLLVTFGYFIYDLILSGTFGAALVSVPFNLLQNAMCIVIASILLPFLKRIPQVKTMMDK